MAAGAAKATNEELIERLQAAGEGTPDAAAIMGELWGQNIRLVRLTVHRLTGLNVGVQGFEDMHRIPLLNSWRYLQYEIFIVSLNKCGKLYFDNYNYFLKYKPLEVASCFVFLCSRAAPGTL